MFWEYGIVASTLDQIFEKDESPTLEDVLNEDDLLQELKLQNEKLVKFLSNSECIEGLVRYLTTDTPDECDLKTRFRYPNLSSEVLTTGFAISNLFTESFKYVSDIWNYLCDRKPKNILMICFITKVLGYYASSYPEFIYCFLTEHTVNPIDELFFLSDCPAVCEFIVRLQTRDTHPFYPKFVEFFQSSNLIGKALSFLIPEEPSDKKLGVSLLCVDLIRTVRSSYEYESPSDIDERLILELLRDENLNLIVSNISKPPLDKETIYSGLTVLTSLFNYERVGHINGDPFLIPNSLETQSIRCLKTDFSSFVSNVSIIQNILNSLGDETRISPSGQPFASLGPAKLLAVELLVSLMLHPSEILSAEFKKLETLSLLWDMVEMYPQNNFLHSMVQLVSECILQGVRWRGLHDPKIEIDDNLIKSILEDAKIIERVIRLSKHPVLELSGHITEVLRMIRSCSNSSYYSDIISGSINGLPESLKSEYEEIVTNQKKADELEAVDHKFTKGVFMNYEENNEEFGTFSSQFLLSFDKGISLMRNAKEALRFDENFENVENEMNINIKTDYCFEGDNLTDLKLDLSIPPMNYQFFNNISPILNAEIDTVGDQDECEDDSESDQNQVISTRNSDSFEDKSPLTDTNLNTKKWFDRFSTLDEWYGDKISESEGANRNEEMSSSGRISSLKNDDVSRRGTSSPLHMDIHQAEDFEAFSGEETKDENTE